MLLSGVIGFLPKCAWKGAKFLVFCLDMRYWHTSDFIDNFIENAIELHDIFTQLKRLLIVCNKRSCNPIALIFCRCDN